MFQGMDPKLVKQAMKKMGLKQEEIPATEVIIKTEEKDYIIHNPTVTKVNMMGEESFQITGNIEEYIPISSDDIETVIEQTSCSKEEAISALKKTNGDIAEAILELQK